jgi:hypothetical protein
MNQKRRRFMLFGTIILLGTMLAILEIDPILLIGSTVCMGVIMLIASGGLRRTSRSAPAPKEPKLQTKERKPSSPKEKTQKRGFFAKFRIPSLSQAFARLRFRGKKQEKAEINSIDELLDRALAENPVVVPVPQTPVPPAPAATTAKAAGGAGMDAFIALSSAELEEDLVTGIGQDEAGGRLDLSPDTPREGAEIATEPDEVAEILKAHEGELGNLGVPVDADALAGDLDSLKDIDLGSLEIEAEQGAAASTMKKEETPPSLPATVPVPPPVIPALQNPDQSAKGGGMDLFVSGNKGQDDVLSALKSDMKKVKLGKDPTLVRNMKDVTVQGKELEADLANLLDSLK